MIQAWRPCENGLEFDDAGEDEFVFDLKIVDIFLGTGKAFVADVLVNNFRMNTVFKLVGDESMAEIVDFDVFQAGLFEIAVDAGANVSNE